MEKPAPTPAATPSLSMEKERRRADQAFSEALRNTPGMAWDHMQQVKKLMEQWEKAPDREAFERKTLKQFQELARQHQQRGQGMGR